MTRKWIWTSIAISAMWLAVLFASVFGGEIVIEDSMDHVSMPMGVVVAGFAFLATIIVGAIGFRGEPPVEARDDFDGTRAAPIENGARAPIPSGKA